MQGVQTACEAHRALTNEGILATAGPLRRGAAASLASFVSLATVTSSMAVGGCKTVTTAAVVNDDKNDENDDKSDAPQKVVLPTETVWGAHKVRLRGERNDPTHAVVLLHGWGAPGDDLVSLADFLSAPGRLLVFPEAPLVSPGGGRAWWHLDIEALLHATQKGLPRDLANDIPEGLAPARDALQSTLKVVGEEAGLPMSKVALGGFSQGAMLSVATAVAPSPDGKGTTLGGLVILSGSLLAEKTWPTDWATRLKGLPVFQSHGRQDPVLQFSTGEALFEKLEQRVKSGGDRVDWHPFDGQHEIPLAVLQSLRQFLAPMATTKGSGPAGDQRPENQEKGTPPAER